MSIYEPRRSEPRWKANKLPLFAVVGIAIVIVNLGLAAFAPWIAPYGEADLLGSTWQSPSPEYWLGLDNLGRDMLSRIIYGARTTMFLATSISTLAFIAGTGLGFAAAAFGSILDIVLSRTVDVLMSIPTLILALMLIAVFGTSNVTLIAIAALLQMPPVFRVSRAIASEVLVMDFVEVARLRGERFLWIACREILPNVTAPLLAEFGLRFCYSLLFVSALSFLGLGVQPPTADWGAMVRENGAAISFGAMASLIPATAIAVLAVGVNLVVDWLLDGNALGKDGEK
jgi:peptide/nickel transport system permease protein